MIEFLGNQSSVSDPLGNKVSANKHAREWSAKPKQSSNIIIDKKAQTLEILFKECFVHQYNTILVGGADEPLYEPASSGSDVNRIFYRHDYFSSALHEIAHWCIAGQRRRTQTDYGYWYAPDGRTSAQQCEFERVEVKPQAIEWAFSMAATIPFRVSIDNLQAANSSQQEELERQEIAFTKAVKKQLNAYINTAFSARAQTFIDSLHRAYLTSKLGEQK